MGLVAPEVVSSGSLAGGSLGAKACVLGPLGLQERQADTHRWGPREG